MKRMYLAGCAVIWFTFLFWLVYTVAFLFIDGWHMHAISPVEKTLDAITSIAWNTGLLLVLIPMGSKLGDIVQREN